MKRIKNAPQDGTRGPIHNLRGTAEGMAGVVGQSRLLRRRLPPGEPVLLPVRSGSMAPLMPVGSRIAVEAVAGDRCEVGDVAVFARGQRLVAHRLLLAWAVGADRWFLERGDGVSAPGLVPQRAILGRVVAVHGPQGETVVLDSPVARWHARRAVRKSLKTMVRDGLLALVRRVTP